MFDTFLSCLIHSYHVWFILITFVTFLSCLIHCFHVYMKLNKTAQLFWYISLLTIHWMFKIFFFFVWISRNVYIYIYIYIYIQNYPFATGAPADGVPASAPSIYHTNKYVLYTVTGQNYFHTKMCSYIILIKPLIFITFSLSHSLVDFHEIFTFNSRIIRVNLISSCNFFELLFTSIYDLNTNVNSWPHNFIWLYSKILWKN